MEGTELVKNIIDETHQKSNGSCGVYIVAIQRQTQLAIDKLNPILRILYNEKYFVLRQGLNGRLIFKKV